MFGKKREITVVEKGDLKPNLEANYDIVEYYPSSPVHFYGYIDTSNLSPNDTAEITVKLDLGGDKWTTVFVEEVKGLHFCTEISDLIVYRGVIITYNQKRGIERKVRFEFYAD